MSRLQRCILHVGTTKTGSTSIQESLYFHLRDNDFHYCSLGEVSGDNVMATAFHTDPGSFEFNQKLGLSGMEAQRASDVLTRRLADQLLKSSRQGKTVILSAENIWVMNPIEMQRIKDFLEIHNYKAEAYIYFRPWESWIESDYQEGVKQGARRDDFFPPARHVHLDYLGQLSHLQEVFGMDRVHAYAFAPESFSGGCVVQDFCNRAGIPFPKGKTIRVNDGLSLDALKLLFAFRRYHQGYQPGLQSIIHNEILFRRIAAIPGSRIRFSDQMLLPYRYLWQDQIEPMSKILGASFLVQKQGTKASDLIEDLSQMMDYSDESLAWLSRSTGLAKISKTTPEATTNAVGEQMDYLCNHPSLKSKWDWHTMIARRRFAHFISGV